MSYQQILQPQIVGASKMSVVYASGSSLTIGDTGDVFVQTANVNTTWLLPPLSTSQGRIVWIINAAVYGLGEIRNSISINTSGSDPIGIGGNHPFPDNGTRPFTNFAGFTLWAGRNMILIATPTYWKVAFVYAPGSTSPGT